ncbi:MAG: SpoIIE family protein phosphatase [Anaerolineae bacterium]|nr:SpoIIE family protein phosphatase [Anaerolineae bacterium]
MKLTVGAHIYQALVAIGGLGALVYLILRDGVAGPPLAVVVFILLSTIVKRAGFRIVPDATHSLVGIVDIAALLLFGPVTGALVAASSEIIYLTAHTFRRYPFNTWTHLATPLFEAGLSVIMALAAGWVYLALGGRIPPTRIQFSQALPMLGLFLTWFTISTVGWFLRAALIDGWRAAWGTLRRIGPTAIAVELIPLPFAPLMAAVYAVLGPAEFSILALMLLAVSLLIQSLGRTRQALGERVAELTTFEELGQAIVGAQMDVKRLAELAYQYTTRIVSGSDFRLVLLDSEKNTLRPALWVQNSERQPLDQMLLAGVAEWLREASEAQALGAAAAVDAVPGLALAPDTRSLLAVPLQSGRDVIGGILVQSPAPGAFSYNQARMMATLASQLAVGVENARLYEREWKRAIQLSAISEVSRQVAAIINLEDLFGRVVQLVQASFGYDFVQILTVNDTGEAIFRASTGYLNEARRARGYIVPTDRGIIGWVASHGEPLMANDVAAEPRYVRDPEAVLRGTRSELAVPLKVESRVVGVLDVQSSRINAFDRDDLFVLQTLADQIAIAIEEARLYEETLARQRLEQELALAAEIQSSLLPESPPLIGGWEVAAFWRPALEMAGDFYDFLALTEGRWGFVIADVSDKGIPAAIFMAVARSSIRASVLGRRPPAEALARANALLLNDTRADMFVTLCYCILEPTTGALTYVNAGHTPPLVYRAATNTTEYLESRGIVLGAVDGIELEERQAILNLGDVLVLYTDGVTEAIDAQEEDFGETRLAETVHLHHTQNAADIIEAIIAAVTTFTEDAPQFDDYALVVIKRDLADIEDP